MRELSGLMRWAHVLWQTHGLRPEEFINMPLETQIWYMASEAVYVEEHKGDNAVPRGNKLRLR